MGLSLPAVRTPQPNQMSDMDGEEGNPAFESLCYVTGFGNFNDCGFDEHEFYQILIEKTRE